MKIEIEIADNGYIITMPPDHEDSAERKIVIQENDDDVHFNDSMREFEAFSKLVGQLQEIFGVYNSKHNTIGYLQGLCSEDMRWEFKTQMDKSLENPKNYCGD